MLNDPKTVSTPDRHRLIPHTTLSTFKVENAAQENLGTLHDIVLDVVSGKIVYGILSYGGFLGLGDRHLAIPWSRLAVDEVNQRILVNIERETLENSPEYDHENPPDISDPSWGSKVHDHFGAPPYWIGEGPATALI